MNTILYRDAEVTGEEFDKIKYKEQRVWNTKFRNCKWVNCRFEKFSFANNTTVDNCLFEGCKFIGQYMYFGGLAIYRNVQFNNCVIKNANFWKTELHNVSITGVIENVVFYGKEADKDIRTGLGSLDLTNSKLIDCDFRMGFIPKLA